MTNINEVNNMANNLDFVLNANKQKQNAGKTPDPAGNLEVQKMSNELDFIKQNAPDAKTDQPKGITIPDPLPNAFGGMTGKETVFDIQMQAIQGDAAKTKNPDGMGDILDILG